MPFSTAIMRIHLSLLMLIVRVFNHGYKKADYRSGVLLFDSLGGFANIHGAIANREPEKRTACARASAHGSLSDARFLARRESLVSDYDLTGAQNLGIDVAVEPRR